MPGGTLLDAAFSPDGAAVALASSAAASPAQRDAVYLLPDGKAGNVQFWDWRTGVRRWGPMATPTEPRALAFSPDGATLAVYCADGRLLLLDGPDGRVRHRLDTGNRSATGDANLWVANGCARFSPDGRRLVTWEAGNAVQVWAPQTGALLLTLPHDDRIADIAFAPGQALLLTAGRDGFARLWDLETGGLSRVGRKS